MSERRAHQPCDTPPIDPALYRRDDMRAALARHGVGELITDPPHRREDVVAHITLAQVHVQTGDSRGLAMARQAITAVAATKSVNARRLWLVPLSEALEKRPGSDARELARTARQVATTPA